MMRKTDAVAALQGWKRRVMGTLGALLVAGSAVALTATAAAAADPHCNYPYGSNTCLTIEDIGWGISRVLVGIDVQMSQQEAQYLIDANGGRPFVVQLLAHDHDDPADDTSGLGEFDLNDPRISWSVSAWEGGLSGSFAIEIASYILNEDKDGRDEIVARVELYDPHYPGPAPFHSGIVVGYW